MSLLVNCFSGYSAMLFQLQRL